MTKAECQRRWYQKNRERCLEYGRRYKRKKWRKVAAYMREWRRRNSEHIRESSRRYRATHRAQLARWRKDPTWREKRRKQRKAAYARVTDADRRERRAKLRTGRETLSDEYIRILLRKQGLRGPCPPTLVEAKRAQVLVLRAVHQKENTCAR
jgi:hypothetical protein